MRTLGLICLALAGLTVAVFAPVVAYDFVDYDDPALVANNPVVHQGLTVHGIRNAFATTVIGHWHPVTLLSYMLDATVYGMSGRGFHGTSLLIHLANTILLFFVLRRATGAVWASAFCAAFFGVHPLHVEPVAWIASRKDVLSTLFLFLTLWAYLDYVDRPSVRRMTAVAGLFATGLMAKGILITVPVLLILIDVWPLKRLDGPGMGHVKRLVLEKLPLFALSAISAVVTLFAAGGSGAMHSTTQLSLVVRVLNAIVAYGTYLAKLVWPTRLAPFYPHPGAEVPVVGVIVAAVALLVLTIAFVALARRAPYLLVGWLWFAISLGPVIGILQAGDQAWADRYTYLSYTGLFVIVCWGVPALATRLRLHKAVVPALGTAAIIALAVVAGIQVRHWRNTETLFTHTLAVTEDNHVAHNNLGQVLARAGRTEKAIEHFTAAIAIAPDYPAPYTNLGAILGQSGQVEDALAQFERALEVAPFYVNARYNLALALEGLGRADEAMAQYRRVIETDPNHIGARSNLGLALAAGEDYEGAIEQYEIVLRSFPKEAITRFNLGASLIKTGELEQATRQFEILLRNDPKSERAQQALDYVRALMSNQSR
ncbi:MAG: tetratricopeptide repeat protein [bacterium]|nr:tetratricopeptide repeat protein [bacterium]